MGGRVAAAGRHGNRGGARARNANAASGAVRVSAQAVKRQWRVASDYPTMGVEAELLNLLTGQEARARMAAVRRTRGGEIQGIAVEMLAPDESFWGLNFQLRKTSAELLRLEKGMKIAQIDPVILREFQEAVDYVRKTAWAVQEWRERQIQHRDPSTVLSLLTLERIRRATSLTHDLLEDLKAQEVGGRTEGVTELHQAVEKLHERLNKYFGDDK